MDLEGGELLGGSARKVVVDECFVARRKYNNGRAIPTHKICVMSGVELESAPRADGNESDSEGGGRQTYVETGRSFLAITPDCARETFKGQIRKRVAPGSTVWTDSRKSYEWAEAAGYDHMAVNRSISEFVGKKGQSASAVEGMWSRVKRGLRLANTRKPPGNDYAALLAEYGWRTRNIRGRQRGKDAFGHTLALVSAEFSPDFQRDVWMAAWMAVTAEDSSYADN